MCEREFDDQNQQKAWEIIERAAKEVAQYVPEIEPGSDRCPYCGTADLSDAIAVFDREANIGVSMSSGPFDAADWKVLRVCACCKKLFVSPALNY